MCNIYTNEHYWVIGSSTSQISAPYVGQPCQCGSVRWQAAQQNAHPTVLPHSETAARCPHCHQQIVIGLPEPAQRVA